MRAIGARSIVAPMSIGLAIVLVAIIGFAIYSRGFRRAVLIALGVVVAGVALLFYNSSTPGAQKKRARPLQNNRYWRQRLRDIDRTIERNRREWESK